MSKLMAVLLALAMCLSLLPATAFADGACEHEGDWTFTVEPGCFSGGDFGTGTAAATGLEIKPLGHSWGEWTVITAATTEKAGLEVRTCTRVGCGETEEKEISQLTEEPEHTHLWNNRYDPNAIANWGKDDNGHYHYCTVNGCTARKDEAPHTYDTARRDGKCTVCGMYCSHTYVDGVCSKCGVPCWHIDADRVDHVDATCLNEGTIAHLDCPVCKQVISLEGDTRGKPVTSTAIPVDSGNHDGECGLSYVEKENGTHDQVRSCGVVVVEGEAHEYEDGKCAKCGAEEPGPGQPDSGTVIPFTPDVPPEVEIDGPDVPLAGLMTRAEFVNYLYVQGAALPRSGQPSATWPRVMTTPWPSAGARPPASPRASATICLPPTTW